MPTTLLSASLFVMLLFPGYVYERRRERDVPERTRSSFRETIGIVFIGVISDAVAVATLHALASTRPSLRLDLTIILSDPGRYVAQDLPKIGWWVAAVLTGASGFAYLVASRPWSKALARRSPSYARRGQTSEPQQSAWWMLLYREHPNTRKYVICHLDDGSYVAGTLHSISRTSNETADRDLSLRHDSEFPLTFRPKGSTEAHRFSNVGALVVSARRIVFLTVTYLPPANPPNPDPPHRKTLSMTPNMAVTAPKHQEDHR